MRAGLVHRAGPRRTARGTSDAAVAHRARRRGRGPAPVRGRGRSVLGVGWSTVHDAFVRVWPDGWCPPSVSSSIRSPGQPGRPATSGRWSRRGVDLGCAGGGGVLVENGQAPADHAALGMVLGQGQQGAEIFQTVNSNNIARPVTCGSLKFANTGAVSGVARVGDAANPASRAVPRVSSRLTYSSQSDPGRWSARTTEPRGRCPRQRTE